MYATVSSNIKNYRYVVFWSSTYSILQMSVVGEENLLLTQENFIHILMLQSTNDGFCNTNEQHEFKF